MDGMCTYTIYTSQSVPAPKTTVTDSPGPESRAEMCIERENKVWAPQSRDGVDSIGSVDQLNGYAQCLDACNVRHWSAVRDSGAARVKAVAETTCSLQTVVKSPAGFDRGRRRNAADAITSNHIRKRSAVSASPCLQARRRC
jgi:hypothetical protein